MNGFFQYESGTVMHMTAQPRQKALVSKSLFRVGIWRQTVNLIKRQTSGWASRKD
jgi:hypothetical protein